LTYLYDSGTGLNNFQSKQGVQTANAKIIAKRKIYPQIDNKEFYGFNFWESSQASWDSKNDFLLVKVF